MHKRVPDTYFFIFPVGCWLLAVGCFFKQVEKKKRMKLRKK